MTTSSRLEAILAANHDDIVHLMREHRLGDLIAEAQQMPDTRGFRAALVQPGIALIAEVKHASPSAGVICPNFDPLHLAREYERAGANAVSVLTERRHFRGAPEHLVAVRREIGLPLLRKDFLVTPHQIAEARLLGADAVLLIAALLDTPALISLTALAHELGMDALVEVHDEEELERALEADAQLIGVNNRNLHTFEVSLATTFALRNKIPPGVTLVSESGIKTREDVLALEAIGVDAVLVGETIARSDDPAATIRMLMGAASGDSA